VTEQLLHPPSRVATGIPGLDTVLQGGFLQGNTYLIIGTPGAGKTILCNQMAFHRVAEGERVVYVTLLAEGHAHLLSHLRSLAFFTPGPIGEALFYFSASSELEQHGLDGLLKLLQAIIRDKRPSVLILDSLSVMPALNESELAQKNFLWQLQTWAQAYACTVLLIKLAGQAEFGAEHTLVDGIIELSDHALGLRAVRQLHVRKFRGSGYLRGAHLFDITNEGLVVYPRTEALLSSTESPTVSQERVSTGIEALDEMLGGGLFAASSAIVLGVTGSGKTLIGLSFLIEGARRGEVGLYFGFSDFPSKLTVNAAGIGLPLEQYVAQNLLHLVWQPAYAHVLDELSLQLLSLVETHHVRRLFIDGLDALRDTSVFPEHALFALTALLRQLQRLGVTIMGSVELEELFGPAVQIPLTGITKTCDTLIFLRQVELKSQLYRLISIMKMQGGSHSRAIREFTIQDSGITVADTFESAEALLTGVARPLPLPPGMGRRRRA
jgi:circadian clock protein KaiC